MKKLLKLQIMTGLIIALLALAACQGSSSAVQTVENAQVTMDATVVAATLPPSEPTIANTNTLEAYQLLFGILKLQNTNQAITMEQAVVLLPLWTNYQTLTASKSPVQAPGENVDPSADNPETPQVDTETQTQLDEILTQIQAALTEDQVSAIESLQITQESTQTLMQELGITMGDPGQGADGTQPQGGGGPGGDGVTPPDGGGNPPEGETPPDGGGGQPPADAGNAPVAEGTPFAGDGNQPSSGGRLSTEALTALIDYLLSLTNAQ